MLEDLEKQVNDKNNEEKCSKQLDKYVQEIESLKHRIWSFEAERNNLVKRLNEQINLNNEKEKKILDLQDEGRVIEEEQLLNNPNENIGESRLRPGTSNSLYVGKSNQTLRNYEIENTEEDKDEQIIALQNKLIAFNQKNVSEFKELESEKEEEILRLRQEKEEILQEFNEKLEEQEVERNKIIEQNDELKEKLNELENVLDTMQQEVFENPWAKKLSESKAPLKKEEEN